MSIGVLFCPKCGRGVENRIPKGDNRPRAICPNCNHIEYQNPKVVTGAVVIHNEKILLCRRAIEPRRGYWTIPAGFMELGETTIEGAAREAKEEALAELDISQLLAVFSLPRGAQVQTIYLSKLKSEEYGVGEESLEVELFTWEEALTLELAFPTVDAVLKYAYEFRSQLSTDPSSIPVLEKSFP